MDDELFDLLIKSVKQGGAIMRGEVQPSRVTEIHPPDVKKIRAQLGLSQDGFAKAVGVGVGTIRNWEQERRKPTGPARVLLSIIEARPDVLQRTAPRKRRRAKKAA